MLGGGTARGAPLPRLTSPSAHWRQPALQELKTTLQPLLHELNRTPAGCEPVERSCRSRTFMVFSLSDGDGASRELLAEQLHAVPRSPLQIRWVLFHSAPRLLTSSFGSKPDLLWYRLGPLFGTGPSPSEMRGPRGPVECSCGVMAARYGPSSDSAHVLTGARRGRGAGACRADPVRGRRAPGSRSRPLPGRGPR